MFGIIVLYHPCVFSSCLMWINSDVCWYSRTRFILFLWVSICNYLVIYRNSIISLYITGSGQLFHYESMKWSQLKKNPTVKSLIIEIENHNTYCTRSIHSYDLRYDNEGKIWSLEYWKQIQSQWTNLWYRLKSIQFQSNQWIQMIFNLNWMVVRKRVPIIKRTESNDQGSFILHDCR